MADDRVASDRVPGLLQRAFGQESNPGGLDFLEE